MNLSQYCKKIILVTYSIFLLGSVLFAQEAKDIVHGNLIQFNDNGLWCWFQDERAVVDTVESKLILGGDASQAGVGYSARNGAIEAVIYDFPSGTSERYQLAKMGPDDHNVPGFIIRPDGKYIAMYSAHYDYYKNRYRIFDGDSWSSEDAYDWELREGGTNYTIAYNSIYYLSDEGRMYNFTRANNRTPNFIISDDMGDNWIFGAQLTTNSSNSYNKGYYKYWSNGVDRIDYLFTEQHPRDTLSSIYHGYFKGGKAYDSFDNIVDDDIYNENFLPTFKNYTKVFANGTTIGSNTFYRCWQADFVRYDDGTLAAIITARQNQYYSPGYPDNGINPEHAFIYCRFDGNEWSYTYLSKAGLKFYESEADYVGLGALDPNDPSTLYISSPWDPRDTTVSLGVREIFKGVTTDKGETWSWTPITENSVRDNIRPIIPEWSEDNTVLLWCRGSYISAQSFDAAIVGIIDRKDETVDKKYYVDATVSNTTYVDSAEEVFTGPADNKGPIDDQWHIRTNIGNSGTVFTSAEIDSFVERSRPPRYVTDDAPMIKTHVNLPDGGTYDIWVNFWGYPDEEKEWRIAAGLSKDNTQLFRSMSCSQVSSSDYYEEPVIATGDSVYLYQAYVGRVNNKRSIDVFINDSSYMVGTSSPSMRGDVNRTWYDGVSYAKINGTVNDVKNSKELPLDFALNQNYPNPFNPTTNISYAIPKSGLVNLKVYNILGKEIATLVNKEMQAGKYEVIFDASKFSSGVYFYTLTFENHSSTNKMVLLK